MKSSPWEDSNSSGSEASSTNEDHRPPVVVQCGQEMHDVWTIGDDQDDEDDNVDDDFMPTNNRDRQTVKEEAGTRKRKKETETDRQRKKRKREDKEESEDVAAVYDEDQEMFCNVLAMDMTNQELELKEDHHIRPLWVCASRLVLLETFSPLYSQATEFLSTIAEPISRPQFIHEYRITSYSLYAALSVGQSTEDILTTLRLFSKVIVPDEVEDYVRQHTDAVGVVSLVLRDGCRYIETREEAAMAVLQEDRVLQQAHARAMGLDAGVDTTVGATLVPNADKDSGQSTTLVVEDAEGRVDMRQLDIDVSVTMAVDSQTGEMVSVHSFEVHSSYLQVVLDRCKLLGYPLLQEYEYERKEETSTATTTLPQPGSFSLDLKPSTRLRGYQEKSLSRMFNNGRARSGIVVLPCGSGKTLVGIAAACTIRKRTLVITTVEVAVQQWKAQFRQWTTIRDSDITMFTSKTASDKRLNLNARIVVSTYSMIGYGEKRSSSSQQMMDTIQQSEWGLLILDEAHVANSFKRCFQLVPAQCKLGLTATFVREDDKISELLDLIGSKLYEANWFDLTEEGHIATVECSEVWCQMTPAFYRKYLERPELKEYLAIMNPNKFRACDYLIKYHRAAGDKIIVFCDRRFPLEHYARALDCPLCIHGGTPDAMRHEALEKFRTFPDCNVIFISKVGDNAIDLPEANVIIQISSHFGARRQEAQRLGRILRPKKRKKANESDSFFYSLLSLDTHEMRFAPKRQLFLLNQGYSYKVITNLSETDNADLIYGDLSSQLRLLSTVLTAGEEIFNDEDDALSLEVRRVRGSAAALAGSTGRHYTEFAARRARPAAITALLHNMKRGRRRRRS